MINKRFRTIGLSFLILNLFSVIASDLAISGGGVTTPSRSVRIKEEKIDGKKIKTRKSWTSKTVETTDEKTGEKTVVKSVFGIKIRSTKVAVDKVTGEAIVTETKHRGFGRSTVKEAHFDDAASAHAALMGSGTRPGDVSNGKLTEHGLAASRDVTVTKKGNLGQTSRQVQKDEDGNTISTTNTEKGFFVKRDRGSGFVSKKTTTLDADGTSTVAETSRGKATKTTFKDAQGNPVFSTRSDKDGTTTQMREYNEDGSKTTYKAGEAGNTSQGLTAQARQLKAASSGESEENGEDVAETDGAAAVAEHAPTIALKRPLVGGGLAGGSKVGASPDSAANSAASTSASSTASTSVPVASGSSSSKIPQVGTYRDGWVRSEEGWVDVKTDEGKQFLANAQSSARLAAPALPLAAPVLRQPAAAQPVLPLKPVVQVAPPAIAQPAVPVVSGDAGGAGGVPQSDVQQRQAAAVRDLLLRNPNALGGEIQDARKQAAEASALSTVDGND